MTKRQTLRMAGLGILIATSCGTTGDALTNSGVAGDPDTDGTRLKVMYHRWNASDGTRTTIPVNRFYDTKLKVECTFTLAEDGVSRCLPVDINHMPGYQTLRRNGYFQDSACTQPLHSAQRCDPKPEYAVEVALAKPCTSGSRMHKMTGKVTVPVYSGTAGSCKALTSAALTSLLSSTALYATTPVAAAEFVSGDLQTVILP